MGKNQFVVKHGSQWAVKGANNTRATKITGTQREAISIAIMSTLADVLYHEMRSPEN